METHIPASRLERRIRLLLHAYPLGYRADRGEEMLGTLLEATPDGRVWPSARDSWSLLSGGIRARRAANRQPGPAASLRQATVLGLTLYLSLGSAEFFIPDPLTRAHGTPMLAGFLLMATVLAVWAGRRALMITTAAAGCAVLAYWWYSYWSVGQSGHHPPLRWMVNGLMSAVPLLLGMLALVLTRRDGRPARSWLILACAPLLAMLVARALPVLLRPRPVPGLLQDLLPDVFLLLAIPALAWLATDARPALGVALAHVLSQAVTLATTVQLHLQGRIPGHNPGASFWQWDSMGVEKLTLTVMMTAAIVWVLRRQTRPHPR